jgi:NTE family protein
VAKDGKGGAGDAGGIAAIGPFADGSLSPRIGLALAGGAPEGAVYEIGALRALEEVLSGVDLNDLFIYVGVSSGAVLAACLANGITPARLCRVLVGAEPGEPPFLADTFLQPSFAEMARGGRSLPRLLAEALWRYLKNPGQYTLLESLTLLTRALPVGLFDNEPLRVYLESVFSREGRTNDFRRLARRLVVVAADLDSGQAVHFGDPGFDGVPIARAVQASAALPGLYPPVEIGGRHYVDGILLKTLHASVALEAGADLVLCVNPIVPVDTARAIEAGVLDRGKLLDQGLPTVLSQTFRTLIHSRLEAGMAAYSTKFEGADVVRIEPERDDYLMFFTNIFGFAERRAVVEHAYHATLRRLRERRPELAPILARHGVHLRDEVLDDEGRNLWDSLGLAGEAAGNGPRPAPRRLAAKPGDEGSTGAAVIGRVESAVSRLERLLATRATAAS